MTSSLGARRDPAQELAAFQWLYGAAGKRALAAHRGGRHVEGGVYDALACQAAQRVADLKLFLVNRAPRTVEP